MIALSRFISFRTCLISARGKRPASTRFARDLFRHRGECRFWEAAKFVAGIFGHSHALIADATESFADIFNSLVIWRGIVVAAAPPDEEHPYGHSKAEPLAAAFGAVMLFAAAIWIAVKAAIDIYEFFDPQNSFHREPLRGSRSSF